MSPNNFGGRYHLEPGLTPDDLLAIRDDPAAQVVQFSERLNESDYELLEDVVFSTRPDIELRVFGWYGYYIDLSFLRRIPSATKLLLEGLELGSADEIPGHWAGIEVLSERPNLSELTLGILDLQSFEFLSEIVPTLRLLSLEDTFSKRPSLAPISRFTDLQELRVEGHNKGIESIAALTRLQTLTLRSTSTQTVDFLRSLNVLRELSFELGGTKSFDALEHLSGLASLTIEMVRGLADLSFVSRLHSLEGLSLYALRNVTELPSFAELEKLTAIGLENMRGLTDMTSLRNAPALQRFVHVNASATTLEMHIPLLENPALKLVRVGFGSDKRNKQFDEMAQAHGKLTGDEWF